MKNRKLAKKIIKLLILLLCLILLIRLISLTLSKYESSAKATPNIQIAFYVMKDDFQSMSLNLDSLFPSDEPKIYGFSVSNQDGDKICATDMEYTLKIRTTTNLPIKYDLYMNQNYNDSGAQSIIKSDNIEKDEDETYFRIITTETIELTHDIPVTNTYQLVVTFPAEYNTINYKDIIEGIEITVESKQII